MFRDGSARLLVFRVGPERFAVSLESVDEVVDAPLVQRVPDSPASVLGVCALRGELVTVYDARPLLNVDAALGGAGLLFMRDGRRVALAIDDVFDAVSVDESELRPAPGTAAADGILLGVLRRGTDLVAVLDVNALLDAALVVGQGEKT